MSSRDDAIEAGLAWFDDEEAGFLPTLAARIAVPTECQEPSRLPELYRYLTDVVGPDFEAMGYETRVYDNPLDGMGPALLATRIEDDGLPTVLGYGHGDVVRGQEGRWADGRDPWTLSRDGDRLYGRGTADNKGQHTVHMGALKAVLETRGRLGFNHKFLVETGEENGSKGLKQLVADAREDFRADVYLASDGPRMDIGRANLTLGNRGCVNFDLAVDLRDGGHHSGNWGGLLANPGVILAHAIASLVDAKGRLLADFLKPGPIPNSVRHALKDAHREAGAGGPEIDPEWGEPGLTPAEKVYAWNTLEVLAFTCGSPEKPVNAIPPTARANCQLRFVVGTDVAELRKNLRAHLDAHGFGQVTVEDPPPGNDAFFDAARTDPDHPWPQWVARSLARTTGEMPVLNPNSGGSICNDVFQGVLGLPLCWVPLSYGGCSQHAPNEHILWSLSRDGMRIMTGVYWDLGDEGTAYRP